VLIQSSLVKVHQLVPAYKLCHTVLFSDYINVVSALFFKLHSFFWRNKCGLMRPSFCVSVCPCVHVSMCLSVYPQLSNDGTNFYEIWYIHHGTWAHLNGVHHKSLLLICVCMCIPLSFLGNRSVKNICRSNKCAQNNWRIVGCIIFYAVHKGK
jgi:hypothetical protein